MRALLALIALIALIVSIADAQPTPDLLITGK